MTNLTITGISPDEQFGGYDVNLSVKGKPVYIWVNDSCTEMKILKSSFIFYAKKEVKKKVLNTLFAETFYNRTIGKVNIAVL